MDIQFGLENEIGITRQNPEGIDVVAESIGLVRSATTEGVRLRWDYNYEDPHLDARGFRVKELKQDSDEAEYFAQDAARSLSYREIKSDYVLKNGARFYNDHAHPEYCTPECSNLFELLQQDYAGDELLMSCARTINQSTDNPVILFKNNSDFQGHSYGCHENYLLPRILPWDTLACGILAFLVTRQVFCGAGKFGWEEEDRFLKPGFQISQRSDFFSVIQSVDTMQRRPIVNTRDEPHADPGKYRRFHVIIGDANMSPFATWLKVGSTALVLQALVNRAPLDRIPRLVDPLYSLKAVSRDPSRSWHLPVEGEKEATAISVQRRYLDLVQEFLPNLDAPWQRLVEAWATVLDDLKTDPLSTADRLDWSAKYQLIESFRESEKLKPEDPWLRSLDLSYHRLDKKEGLFYGLLETGSVTLPYPMQMISGNGINPPKTTRAAVRGRCIEKFGSRVDGAQWDFVRLKGDSKVVELSLSDLFDTHQVRIGLDAIEAANRIEDLASLPFARVL